MDRIQQDPGLYDPAWTDPAWTIPEPDLVSSEWDPVEELAQILAAPAAANPAPTPLDTPPPRRSSRRRIRNESHLLDGGRRVTHITLLIGAVSLCAVIMLVWSVAYSYGQLRAIASAVLPMRLAQWWPLTVYGPWFVAALSVLRATAQRRSARRSWCIVLAASAMAVGMCVSHSSQRVLSLVIFGIPPVTALVCFSELVGQLSSRNRPRHAAHTDPPNPRAEGS
ncbi:hypothetical protein BFF78_23080 [Streptomyces fodineus]|uniref:DUF2637 domain-containing protein n=1 Tax=Streptomyces fodineus TaxID=1904616 RepID=A0A1D7YDF1_9ACTN|nr:DUF2637 domain-containing protein [Streptomyces fodineus]AOR33564.1 hypothetical protein BFF78_23080 [Streptomyces fodineus]